LKVEEIECFSTSEQLIEVVPLKNDSTAQFKEFVDATETITECANCHEQLNESSFDHHVCPRVKIEKIEEDDNEEESTYEQDTLDDSMNQKKKYPKKKLKDPITCPKCNRLFYYKAYFQFHFKDVHREDREEICQYCGKVFKNSRRLNSHIFIHQTNSETQVRCL
jgi:hypothetical protein